MASNRITNNPVRFTLGIILLIAVSWFFFYTRPRSITATQIIPPHPVFRNLAASFPNVVRIRITVPDGAFQMIKKDGQWIMPERSNHIVSTLQIATLSRQLSNLERGSLATNDPGKFDVLGVGEPKEFGFGTTMELFNAKDELLYGAQIGQKGQNIYVRDLGESDVYSAKGELFDISSRASWLDFSLLNFKNNPLNKIEFTDSSGHVFKRDGAFLNDIKPIDVSAISRITSSPSVIFIASGKNGSITGKIIHQYHQYWLVLNGPDSLLFAANKNWAYAIKDDDFNAIFVKSFSKDKDSARDDGVKSNGLRGEY